MDAAYTPLYSGVFWDVQDAFLEDLEQIEVIRGPGTTVTPVAAGYPGFADGQ